MSNDIKEFKLRPRIFEDGVPREMELCNKCGYALYVAVLAETTVRYKKGLFREETRESRLCNQCAIEVLRKYKNSQDIAKQVMWAKS